MEFRPLEPNDALVIEALFVSVFSESADEQEGGLVGGLAKKLVACTGGRDVYGFAAVKQDRIVGAICFSRLTFDEPLDAFILAPVAVHGGHQRTGIGQSLIAHGLRQMARHGVSFVVTYGDPAFYMKVGFHPLSTDVVQPPYKLSQPEGWLGQSLSHDSLISMHGRCSCVEALDDPTYW